MSKDIDKDDENLDNSRNSSETIAMWRVIYTPIMNIVSENKRETTREQTRSFLEALLRSDLSIILVPPSGFGPVSNHSQQQYTAFATWLFGVMFHITSSSQNDKILQYSIELQARMLRILSRNQISMLSFIINEYLSIVDELSNCDESGSEEEKIKLSKFLSERNIIENLDLAPFPIIIEFALLIQISLLQLILKSGVSIWNYSSLWKRMMRVLVNSPPEVKISSLKVFIQLLKQSFLNEDTEPLMLYVVEILNTIPTWFKQGIISQGSMLQYSEILSEFLKSLRPSINTTNISFEIIDLIYNKFLGEGIENIVYENIVQYLEKNPSSCNSNLEKFVKYAEALPRFFSVLIHYVYNDVKSTFPNPESIGVASVSELWRKLRKISVRHLVKKNFDYIHTILKFTCLLDSWFMKDQIDARLFEEDMEILLNHLIENLMESDTRLNPLIFQCLIQLMTHKESDKKKIREIFSMRWITERSESMEVDKDSKRIIGLLNLDTKVKLLESFCQCSSEKTRLDILKNCISYPNSELVIAGVSTFLLLSIDEEIRAEDILRLFHKAISVNSPEVQEILVEVSGKLICLLSKCASLIRESPDRSKFVVKCNVCDEPDRGNDSRTYNLSLKSETIIASLFEPLMTSNSEKVRLQMSANLLHFSNHIKEFNTNKTSRIWLPYIREKNPNIRENVAKVIGYLLQNRISELQQTRILSLDDVPTELDEFVDAFIDILHDSMVEAIKTFDHQLHFQLLLTARNFACVHFHSSESRILKLFIMTIMHPISGPKEIAFATAAFEEVATSQNTTPKKIYIRYRRDFLKMMIDKAVENFLDYSWNMASSIHRVAKCVGYEGSAHLFRRDVHYALSFLIPEIVKAPAAIPLLQDIAEQNRIDQGQMLKDNFQHICSHALLNEESEIGENSLRLVSNITNTSLHNLISRSYMGIFSELFLQFYKQAEKIVLCLEALSKFSGQGAVKFETREQIAEYLNPHLHGVLVTLTSNIGLITDEHTQQCAIASLAYLMRFMGSLYITPLRYKILTTLRILPTFTRPGFRKLAYQAWDAFIRNTLMDDLGPLLPTIFSSVVLLLESYPKETNEMLEYLIVKNEESLSPYIPELFFIENMNVSKSISTIVTTCIKKRKSRCVKENLELWLKRIGHETDDVRFRALIHLKKFLAEHRKQLNELILYTNTNVHPLILQLLDTLIAGCRDKDKAIQLAYGECLGELGAVEPSLLPRRIVSRDDAIFIWDTNEEFACAALIELARGFQMQRKTNDTDCFSLAIQEILKAYDIGPDTDTRIYWESIPFTIKEMIFPFLTSHYVIYVTDNLNDYPHPIYGTDMGSTFEKWAYNWIMSMSQNVKDPTLKRILKTSTPAFKRDVRTVVFFIPHVTAHIVGNGSSKEWKKISEEMQAVITDDERSTIDELINSRPLCDSNVESGNTRVSDEAKRVKCSQVIFLTLEHLHRWLRERRLNRNERYRAIQNFCEMLDGLVLARGSYKSYEYHRALMYLEQHMALSKKSLSDSIERDLLVKIYLQLEEPDGVSGILDSQNQDPDLQQLVLSHEVSGQFQDAATCYEKIVQKNLPEPKYLQGMIQCYLSLDSPYTAMSVMKGALENRPELESLLGEQEAFWQLAHFSKINDSLQKNYLEDLKNSARPDLLPVKEKILSLLGAASQPGSYEHSYFYIMKLHVLNEFEKATAKILENVENIPSIFEEWDERFQLVRASIGVEFILSMRRATLDLALRYQTEKENSENSSIRDEMGKLWLKSAKIARKAGLYQQAYMHILSAGEVCLPQDLCIEKAQLYWQKGNEKNALATLKRCLDNYFQSASFYSNKTKNEIPEERKQCAKAKLLFAKYNNESLNVDSNTSITNFKETVDVWRYWEKSFVAIAQYYESLVDKMSEDEKDEIGLELQVHCVNHYAKSLIYGCKYVHQSMPRVLTIWLEFASRTQKCGDIKRINGLKSMIKLLEVYLERLPTFTWLTAFSQLVSRICHPSQEVQNLLRTIIVKLIVAYPQHCLWMMASVYNSPYPVRKNRCKEILGHEKMRTPEMMKLVKDFRQLWEKLIELSNKKVPEGVHTTTVEKLSSELPALLRSPGFSAIMMPTTNFRKLHLPMKGESLNSHEPFSRDWIQIVGIENPVSLMASLQRPRKISLRGSDGQEYIFMCKPKDDLRKDFRLMEFNDIVNKYLQKDPESRQRRLYIRTYSVVPLNEECGLIEWVPNLVGLRPIIMNIYKERGISVSSREMKTYALSSKESVEKKRKVFLEKLLPRHPPVLSEWFLFNFPDPYGWYEARTAFIRTTAVMSMVGYILGLGDRHGENILFDSKCGDCVHVDFNCLFNRGETFEYPERVPFRLTHNMVEAMGPLRQAGLYRRSCEVTMRVLREQTATLISILTPFVYDPLVSWNAKASLADEERTNEKAVVYIGDIHQRLKGQVRTLTNKEKKGRPQSLEQTLRVEGQTNLLILEAMSIDNLCQMYIGWGAFL